MNNQEILQLQERLIKQVQTTHDRDNLLYLLLFLDELRHSGKPMKLTSRAIRKKYVYRNR
jgi:hypothetical protein